VMFQAKKQLEPSIYKSKDIAWKMIVKNIANKPFYLKMMRKKTIAFPNKNGKPSTNSFPHYLV
jgi:hypothetical protein